MKGFPRATKARSVMSQKNNSNSLISDFCKAGIELENDLIPSISYYFKKITSSCKVQNSLSLYRIKNGSFETETTESMP